MKRLFTFFACLLLTAASVSAQTAQAIVTSDFCLFFDYSTTTYAPYGMYEGHQISQVFYGDQVLNSGASPKWMGQQYLNVTIKESFKQVYPKSTAYWFFGTGGVATITGLENLNTELVTDMSGMFYGYMGKELDLSRFDTSRVTDMTYMFYQCPSLNELDLSYFDTSRVTSMKQMFYNCPNLKKLNLLNFDTSKVTNAEGMFANCKSLTTIYCNDSWSVSTSGVMFGSCESLVGAVAFDSGKTDTSMANPETGYFTKSAGTAQAIVTQNGTLYLTLSPRHWKEGDQYGGSRVSSVFSGSRVLAWDFPGWAQTDVEVTKVVIEESFKDARPNCTNYWFASYKPYSIGQLEQMKNKITSITGLEYLNTSEVDEMVGMFAGTDVTSLDLSHFDTSKVRDMSYMFYQCSKLTSLDLSDFKTDKVYDMSYMFRNCESLTSLDLSSFTTGGVITMKHMFSYCRKLASLNLSSFDTSQVSDMECMFYACESLPVLNVSGFNTGTVTTMEDMFAFASSLTELDLSNFDMTKVKIATGMFENCNSLRTIYCNDSWDGYADAELFHGCVSLSGAALYDPAKVTCAMANPTTGYFTRVETYDLWLCGKQVTKGLAGDLTLINGVSVYAGSQGYAVYDPQTKTLRLKGVLIYSDKEPVILRSKIDGLTIQVDESSYQTVNVYSRYYGEGQTGVLLESPTTITGFGTLNITTDTGSAYKMTGMRVLSDVLVESGHIYIKTTGTGISGSGTLTVEGESGIRIQGMPCVQSLGNLVLNGMAIKALGSGPVIEDPEAAYFRDGMIVCPVNASVAYSGTVDISVYELAGDVNEDGAVNINDVVAIINVMAGSASWANANVNGDPDGAVDINDVVAVINIMASGGGSSSEGTNVTVFTVNGVQFGMVSVKGGTFQMGADDSEADSDEKPVHEVTLSDYAIGQTEVTQELWQAVMGSNPSNFQGGEGLPVEQVSLDDCQTFITKLNELTGKHFRLPTEAEWEYAARGGSKSKGYKYSGSDNIGDVAWYDGNSDSQTHAVASKTANELGIYDMSGNVWEWCQDWYDANYYSASPVSDPTGPASGLRRVIRGSSWDFTARACRVSNRGNNYPDFIGSYNGLRLAL